MSFRVFFNLVDFVDIVGLMDCRVIEEVVCEFVCMVYDVLYIGFNGGNYMVVFGFVYFDIDIFYVDFRVYYFEIDVVKNDVVGFMDWSKLSVLKDRYLVIWIVLCECYGIDFEKYCINGRYVELDWDLFKLK